MKKIFALIIAFAVAVCAGSLLIASAAPNDALGDNGLPLLIDDADVLNDEEEEALNLRLSIAKEMTGIDIVAVTNNDMGGKTAEEFTNSFYKDNGYGVGENKSGVILLLTFDGGTLHVTSFGDAYNYLPEEALGEIIDYVIGDFSGGRYYDGFYYYAQLVASKCIGEDVDLDAAVAPAVEEDPKTVDVAVLNGTDDINDILSAKSPLLYDGADILTEAEEQSLLARLNDLSSDINTDVAVVTTNSLDGKDIQLYADDYFIDHGYGTGEDLTGILLVVSFDGYNQLYMATHGEAIDVYTDYGIAYIGDEIAPYLHDGNYTAAFERYADLCEDLHRQAENGKPFDVEPPQEEEKSLDLINVAGPAGVGVGAAFAATGSMKSKLKSVKKQSSAGNYVRRDSLQITENSDTFMYSNVARVPRATESSSSGRSSGGFTGGSTIHTHSSSGSSFGGGGRGF